MVDKRFSLVCVILCSFLASIMIILMILLFTEYQFFCRQAKELIELKQQYAQYVELLNKRINGENAYLTSSSTRTLEDILRQAQDERREDRAQRLLLSSPKYQDEHGILTEDGEQDERNIEMEAFLEESPLMIEEIRQAEASDAPDDDDEYVDESFVVINRHPDYLKQSTLDYIESQDLNALMTSIDIDRWSDYSANVVTSVPKKSITQKKTTNNIQNFPSKPIPKITAVRRPIKDCGFIWPIDADKFWLSSFFGPRKRINGTWGFHHGLDMAAVKGTLVKAARSGTVTEASFQTGYGNTVVVQHSDALKTRYAHLHTIRVCVGQKIKQGAMVGTVGETGFIRKKGKDGSHLHFEVYEWGKRINPMHCLPPSIRF